MKKNKTKKEEQKEQVKKFDDTKLIDGIYKLKSYINIIDAFIKTQSDNQAFVDLGLLFDNMAEIINNFGKEYVGWIKPQ